ncbi:helix-turn-helix transcriptional regulator [Candidatus Woesearchaeota archaeon]|nr:helix-turn-helix transcriptional regulator [Candidatus Woesearchaeota archaeon]
METNKTIQIDTKCCKMKSLKGYCPRPLEEASDFLSKKWSISIIITIGNFGILRFNELKDRLEKATAKILTERLRELEAERIVQRHSFNEMPPRVEYSLTKNGKKLMRALHPMIHWAEDGKKSKK